ncbi:MAG TPA: hypothetical protein VHV55_26540 [Pirellulales bacterium]|jgi:hypothetical protein|nr:hypothetical protein [Pirellulales bacterium]
METTITLYDRVLLDVFMTLGVPLFAGIVFFPGWFQGAKKSQRLEKCPKCGRWNKAE